MFNYDKWEERVLEMVDSLENGDSPDRYNEEFQRMWAELMAENKDEHVLFLKEVLDSMKKLLDGDSNVNDVEETIREMRENILP